ncbi:MAG TPA: PLP-dependent aminotransferase family protein [Candidatus Nanoarchaeia archaeon]|nr:PLP-dependent aminotransferase family protein [Candidatus Nanoarchaeia archaeon]
MRTLGGLWLERASRFSLQDQLMRQIKELIQRGTLAPSEPLPSTRELATQLNVSRNTVVYAYDRLVSEGYLAPYPRSGVFVSPSISLFQDAHWATKSSTAAKTTVRPGPAPKNLGSPAPFRPCQPDVTLFPLLIWNRLRGRVLRKDGRNLLHYQASCISGLPALRQSLAAYLRDSRGVKCDWRQVVITSGSQQALYILANVLLSIGDHVYMEDPGYLEARLAWQSARARITGGPVDEEGLKLPTRSNTAVSLIYTTPSRQFPTGVSMSLARRLALIDFASRMQAWVIEDDYDSELRYSAPPLPSLQSLDPSGQVIYVGSFSKLLFPSLRIGYVVVPPSLLERFNGLKHLIDDHLPLIDQATLALFLESGAFYSHIRRCRKAYAQRQEYFLDLFNRAKLPLEFRHTDGGMNVTGFLPSDYDDTAWSQALKQVDFDVPPLSHYSLKTTNPGLVFGFTAFTPEVLKGAFSRMAPVLRGLRDSAAPTATQRALSARPPGR